MSTGKYGDTVRNSSGLQDLYTDEGRYPDPVTRNTGIEVDFRASGWTRFGKAPVAPQNGDKLTRRLPGY